MTYDVIVLANIPAAAALADAGLEVLYDYVTHGGGLLVLGGSHSYGQSKLTGTRMEEMLPVQVKERRDIVKLKDPRITTPNPSHPLFMMVDLSWTASQKLARRAQLTARL